MNASKKASKVKKMSEGQLGYVAGILDGEGHLYITQDHGSVWGRLRVRVTDSCVIRYLKKVTGVGCVYSFAPRQKKADGGDKRVVHEWTVMRRADVRDLLVAVKPWLVLKKQSADHLLELESLKDQGIATGVECERLRASIHKSRGH